MTDDETIATSDQATSATSESIKIVVDEDADTLRQNAEVPAEIHDLTHGSRVAYKCKSTWDSMNGSDCLRQCERCQLWVVKPDGLSAEQLSQLLHDNPIVFNSAIEKRRVEATASLMSKLAAMNGLHRRSDGTFVVGDCGAAPRKLANVAFLMAPFLLVVITCLMAPGYIIPFLNHTVAQKVYLGLAVWHLIGARLFSRASHWLPRTAIGFFFMVPFCFATMFGPCFITLMAPLGPYFPDNHFPPSLYLDEN